MKKYNIPQTVMMLFDSSDILTASTNVEGEGDRIGFNDLFQ